ncbi:MAG: DUF3127 domain-containing protein [Saprospiraceae bacterium]
MSFEVEGKLHKKFDIESKTSSFQAREFVLEVPDGNYPQFVKFQLVQDRCALIDSMNEGDLIKVHFDLRGREWQGKYFTNLNAWRVEKATGTTSAPAPTPAEAGSFPTAADEPAADDDLPF